MNAEQVYSLSDKAAELLNKKAIRRFSKAKRSILLNIDELNIIKICDSLYEDLESDNIDTFQDLAIMVYEDIMKESLNKEEEELLFIWLNREVLNQPDEVTQYTYSNEVERKKERTKEAIIASTAKSQELDRALRYWSQMTTQYGDIITDKTMIKAYKDSGVKKVQWNTEEDDKVCSKCESLNGKIFDIDKVPNKQHWRCRCWLSTVVE